MNKEAIFLLIHGGHIIDPSQGLDQVGDLLIAEGKIVQIGRHCHSEQSAEFRCHRISCLPRLYRPSLSPPGAGF